MAIRRSLSLLLLAVSALWLPACGGDDDDTSPDGDAGQDSGTDTETGTDTDGDSDSDAGTDTDTELDSGPPGDTATWVSAGGSHTCAVIEGGYVKCWGWQHYGELGYGNDCMGDTDANSSLPSTLPFVRVGDAVSRIEGGINTTSTTQQWHSAVGP